MQSQLLESYEVRALAPGWNEVPCSDGTNPWNHQTVGCSPLVERTNPALAVEDELVQS